MPRVITKNRFGSNVDYAELADDAKNTALSANATADLALDAAGADTYADITGATLTLNKVGRWLLMGFAHFAAINARTATVALNAGGTVQTRTIRFGPRTDGNLSGGGTTGQVWLYTSAAGNEVCKLQGKVDAINGDSPVVKATDTTLTAVYLGAT